MKHTFNLPARIITSGRNVPEKAAIEMADGAGLHWSGWTTESVRERGNENGTSGLKPLQASSLYSYAERNLMDADGTLFFTAGSPGQAVSSLQEFGRKRNHPWFTIHLNRTISFQAARESAQWVCRSTVHILNITGDSSGLTGDYQSIRDILDTMLDLITLEQGRSGVATFSLTGSEGANEIIPPRTVPAVVDLLIRKLSLRDRVRLGKMSADDLKSIYFSLGEYIRNELGIWENNMDLVRSCESLAQENAEISDDACVIIIHELWKRLRNTHLIRRVQ